MSVIDARRCNARACRDARGPWPTITVGDLPGAIDRRSRDAHGLRDDPRRQLGRRGRRHDLQRPRHVGLRADPRQGPGRSDAAGDLRRPAQPHRLRRQLRRRHRLDDRQRHLQRPHRRRLPGRRGAFGRGRPRPGRHRRQPAHPHRVRHPAGRAGRLRRAHVQRDPADRLRRDRSRLRPVVPSAFRTACAGRSRRRSTGQQHGLRIRRDEHRVGVRRAPLPRRRPGRLRHRHARRLRAVPPTGLRGDRSRSPSTRRCTASTSPTTRTTRCW